MASASSSSSSLLKLIYRFIIPILLLVFKYWIQAEGGRCYTSIFSFGDSLADTGNLLHIYNASHSPPPPSFGSPPYGNTYFHRPTGRFSDGRLVIDFIAEYFGIPLVPPYFGSEIGSFGSGVNFAVAGATALDNAFLEKRGIFNPMTNISLGIQLNLFKDLLPSLCPSSSSSNCSEILKSSLFLVGEIGGNDYNYPLFQEDSFEDIQSMVPLVVNAISSAISELVDLGAVTLLVPGNLPIGCSTVYLTYFMSKTNKEDYDPSNGCIIWLNKFSEYHNELLQVELDRARQLHPHATIIYADYYNVAMRFYDSPTDFGFKEGGLRACCGGGGPYNYNSSIECGGPLSTWCKNPSGYVEWDGVHLTESAYKWITQGLLQGPFTTPHITSKCVSKADF